MKHPRILILVTLITTFATLTNQPPKNNPEIVAALEETKALLHGHFKLTSERHSDYYCEKFNLLQWPHHTETVCKDIAQYIKHLAPTVVVGPTTAGMIIAYEVARHLGTNVRTLTAELNPNGGRCFPRSVRPQPGDRVLIVDDILTTGGSIRDTVEAVVRAGSIPVGVAVIVDRTNGSVDFGVPFHAAVTLSIQSFSPDECPLCKRNVPLVNPKNVGS